MKIYDVTLPISPSLPVWPGDSGPELRQLATLAHGDECNLSALQLNVHTGTHLDAPWHFCEEGATLDQLPLDTLVGNAWVCQFPPEVRLVTASTLDSAGIPRGIRRLLIGTGNAGLWDQPSWRFSPDYVALSPDAAEWVVARGIVLLGVDYLSVDPFDAEDHPAHRILLCHGVAIVEGLDLRQIAAGSYRMYCLPLKLVGAEGAPARVVLVRDDS